MTEEKKTLSLGGSSSSSGTKKGTLSLKGAPGQQQITQTLARGQSRGVQIEVRKKRGAVAQTPAEQAAAGDGTTDEHLTSEEHNARLRALQKAKEDEDRRREEEAKRRALEAEEEKLRLEAEKTGKRPGKIDADELRRRELEELELIKEEDRKKAEELEKQRKLQEKQFAESRAAAPSAPGYGAPRGREDEDTESVRDRLKRAAGKTTRSSDDDESSSSWNAGRSGRMTVNQVLNAQYERADSGRSLSSVRRARQKAKSSTMKVEQAKQYR